MKLTKPAMLSAFLMPGTGQWVAGHRVLGALIIMVTVVLVITPFARMFLSVLHPAPCDPWQHGALACTGIQVRDAWRVTLPTLLECVAAFVPVYAFAVWHANRLDLPSA